MTSTLYRRKTQPTEELMGTVRVRPLKDGPVEIAGEVDIVDPQGVATRSPDDRIYLCRCGQSATKPFCDGTHKKVGFKGEGWARPASGS